MEGVSEVEPATTVGSEAVVCVVVAVSASDGSFGDVFAESSSCSGSSCRSKQSNISIACCDPSESILNKIDSSLSSGLSSVLLMYPMR